MRDKPSAPTGVTEETRDPYRLLAALAVTTRTATDVSGVRFATFPGTRIQQDRLTRLSEEAHRLTTVIGSASASEPAVDTDQAIGRVAKSMQLIVDRTAAASALLDALHVEATMEQSLEQCRLLREATRHLAEAVGDLPTGHNAREHVAAVRELREQGRTAFRDGVGALYEQDDINPYVIAQMKPIFETLDAALEVCLDTAAALDGLA